ncbi:hypothetical protein ES708_16845 [subsurface metagenome]
MIDMYSKICFTTFLDYQWYVDLTITFYILGSNIILIIIFTQFVKDGAN